MRGESLTSFVIRGPDGAWEIGLESVLELALGVAPMTCAALLTCSDPFKRECESRQYRLPLFRLAANQLARNLKALATTETDERLIANAAIIGESSSPVQGHSTPAAIGTPRAL